MKMMAPVLVFASLLSSCNLQQVRLTFTPEPTLTSSPFPASSPVIPTQTAKSLSLDATPLVWFAPLPPLPIVEGRQFTGSDDFMQLFSSEAQWQSAAAHIQVFKLYGEWVAYKATDAQLEQVVEDLEKRGITLAVEAGPLNAPSNCGQGIEGFAGTQEGLNIARRIKTQAANSVSSHWMNPIFTLTSMMGQMPAGGRRKKLPQKLGNMSKQSNRSSQM